MIYIVYSIFLIIFSLCAKIDKLQSSFHQWESTPDVGERANLSKEVLAGCESIEWQVCLLHMRNQSQIGLSIFVFNVFSPIFLHCIAIICMNWDLGTIWHALKVCVDFVPTLWAFWER